MVCSTWGNQPGSCVDHSDNPPHVDTWWPAIPVPWPGTSPPDCFQLRLVYFFHRLLLPDWSMQVMAYSFHHIICSARISTITYQVSWPTMLYQRSRRTSVIILQCLDSGSDQPHWVLGILCPKVSPFLHQAFPCDHSHEQGSVWGCVQPMWGANDSFRDHVRHQSPSSCRLFHRISINSDQSLSLFDWQFTVFVWYISPASLVL